MASGTFYPVVEGDDGFWYSAGEQLYTTGFVYIGNVGAPVNVFERMLNVTIPPGSTIITCKLQLYSFFPLSDVVCNVKIHFNNIGNAIAPTTIEGADALDLTPAIEWNAIGAWEGNTLYESPELKTIFQPIVDLGGFASGNAVQVVIRDNGSTEEGENGPACRAFHKGFEGGAYSPGLYVEWEEGPGPEPVSFRPQVIMV